MLIDAVEASHRNSEAVLALLIKACRSVNIPEVADECERLKEGFKDTRSTFGTLRTASTSSSWQGLYSQAEEGRFASSASDSLAMKKLSGRLVDLESQVSSQLQAMSQEIERKISFLTAQPKSFAVGETGTSDLDSLQREMLAVRYDVGELKDLLSSARTDAAHVKRIVLACERDMEDFTAAMDSVNVDLDEMRARIDSTHSIITSRQRVEATVAAEISTLRLDLGDLQEAVKAHDAWMEEAALSLQDAHDRCQQLGEEANDVKAKLDSKTDVTRWNDLNDEIDASVKTVRDMASALSLRVRKTDEALNDLRQELNQVGSKAQLSTNVQPQDLSANAAAVDEVADRCARAQADMQNLVVQAQSYLDTRMSKLDAELRGRADDLYREALQKIDTMDKALEQRIGGLQDASFEAKRLREEVNSLNASLGAEIGKLSEEVRRNERSRIEEAAVQEVLKPKRDVEPVYAKTLQTLESNVAKLTRGTVKLCQVVGVFPGARMTDGAEDELDIDVELLNWEDCAQNLTSRVEKTWRQLSSQKYRSILDLVSKKS